MTKNKTNTPSNDGEFLDSNSNQNNNDIFNDIYENGSLESLQPYNLENEQEEVTPTESQNEDVVSLDKTPAKEITIPLVLETSSKSTDTKKYEVALSTDTKFVLNVNGNGQSYSHTTYTKSLNFKAGDFIIIPKEGE